MPPLSTAFAPTKYDIASSAVGRNCTSAAFVGLNSTFERPYAYSAPAASPATAT